MDYLPYLPIIAVMLFLGFSIRLISRKFRLPWVILLILLGFAMRNFSINGEQLFLPANLLITFTLFILIIVVFNDISTISKHEFNTYSEHAIRLTTLSFCSNMIFLTFFFYLFFGFKGILLNILLALVLSSTDITSIFFMFKENKATEVMKYEALMNTPVSLLGSLIIIFIMQLNPGVSNLMSFFPLIKQILLGLGVGAIFSILTFSFMSRFHHRHLSPMLLVFLAGLAYIFTEFIQGMGIFSIAVYALAFEKSLLEKKTELRDFSRKFSDFFSVIPFMLLGYILPSGLSLSFILKVFSVFIAYILLRFGSAYLALHSDFKFREIFFISMTPAKGLTVAVLALFLSEFKFLSNEISNVIIVFLVFSILLSTLMGLFSRNMLKKDIEE